MTLILQRLHPYRPTYDYTFCLCLCEHIMYHVCVSYHLANTMQPHRVSSMAVDSSFLVCEFGKLCLTFSTSVDSCTNPEVMLLFCIILISLSSYTMRGVVADRLPDYCLFACCDVPRYESWILLTLFITTPGNNSPSDIFWALKKQIKNIDWKFALGEIYLFT